MLQGALSGRVFGHVAPDTLLAHLGHDFSLAIAVALAIAMIVAMTIAMTIAVALAMAVVDICKFFVKIVFL